MTYWQLVAQVSDVSCSMQVLTDFTGRIYKATGPFGELVLKKSHVTKHVRYPMLRHEAFALKMLENYNMFPRVYAWGRSQYFEYLFMEPLGSPLTRYMTTHGGRLGMKSVLLLMDQMVRDSSRIRVF